MNPKKLSKFLGSIAIIIAGSFTLSAQAELHLINDSARSMDIKIMNTQSWNGSSFYGKMHLAPYSKSVRYFSKTGHYYIKSKATKPGKDPICEKGSPFEVYNGNDGYSVLTITYSVIESETTNPINGQRISLREFERDD